MLYCLPVTGKGTQRGKIGLKTTYFYFAVFAKDEPNTSCSSVPGNQDWILLGFWQGMHETNVL